MNNGNDQELVRAIDRLISAVRGGVFVIAGVTLLHGAWVSQLSNGGLPGAISIVLITIPLFFLIWHGMKIMYEY